MPAALPTDTLTLRAALERQFALLTPVLDHLRRAAIEPSPLLAADWRGAAADAAAQFLDELRSRLAVAEGSVDDAVRMLRLQIAHLP